MKNSTEELNHISFQARVYDWLIACFGKDISADVIERNHRFLEESLELVQACGCTQKEAHQLVDYVYGRDIGEASQEVGGVMVTLSALCSAQDIDMSIAGETELSRVLTKVEQIRAKQAAKPQFSPLPCSYPDRLQPENPTLNDLWGNFDKAYFKFQSELYAFWGAIDVGRSRSFFADLYTNMHRLRRDMVSMLPDEVRNSKAQKSEEGV